MRCQRIVRVVLGLVVSLCLISVAAGAETYILDKAHTAVSFTVRHLVISKVRGKFNEFGATITLDAQNMNNSSMQGTIMVSSIDTDNEKRDNHLRSADFFDAANYPQITFASKRIDRQGEDYVLIGDLTMRGVTKEIILPFTITPTVMHGGKKRFGFEATLRLNRQDYGIAYNKLMDTGGLVVSDTVDVEINGEAILQES